MYKTKVRDKNEITSTDQSPSGKYVLMGNDEGEINMWGQDGDLILNLKAYDESISAVCFSSDESGFISAAGDEALIKWNLLGEMIAETERLPHPVKNIQISKDGLIATSDIKGNVSLWDENLKLQSSFQAHQQEVAGLAFSPDGQRLATGSRDRTAKLWNLDGPGRNFEVSGSHPKD